jgi:hypothetical protein
MLVVFAPTYGQYHSQLVTLEGTLGLESFDPLFLKATPSCLQPSLTAPILIAANSVFLLKSDDGSISQQLVSASGSDVKISGVSNPFNATQIFSSYSCRPYDCKRIEAWITVTTLEIQPQHNNLSPVFFALAIMLVVTIFLTIALVAIAQRRRHRRSTESPITRNSYARASW